MELQEFIGLLEKHGKALPRSGFVPTFAFFPGHLSLTVQTADKHLHVPLRIDGSERTWELLDRSLEAARAVMDRAFAGANVELDPAASALAALGVQMASGVFNDSRPGAVPGSADLQMKNRSVPPPY